MNSVRHTAQLTLALVGVILGGPPPRNVPMVLKARFAVGSVGSVLAETDAAANALGVHAVDAVGSVAVALTPNTSNYV